jgi:hypothetical protein
MSSKFSLLLIGFALATSQTFGQKDYAVLTKGDTLRGELKIVSIGNLDQVQIKTEQKKITYTALQVKSLSKDKVIYQPVKYDNTFRFMQLIKSGYLSLYAFNASGQNQWNGRYLYKKDGSGMEVPNLAFKKFMSKYLEDCPEMANRITRGDYSRNDIDVVVEIYNTCIQAKSETAMKSSLSASLNSEKITAITKLTEKVEAAQNFLTKKDVTDLLKDINGKVSANQPVPNYLTEGLRSYLADTPDLLKEADDLITLLKK